MPVYNYTAKSFDGQTKSGISVAKDIRELSQDLKKEGLVLVKAFLDGEKGNSPFKISFSFGVSLKDKIILTRNLWIMVSAGLSFVKSFSILANQSRNKKLKKALIDIKDEISKGKNISDAMGRYPDIFSELFQNMVKIGEESGTMDEILKVLTLQMEKEHELKSKIQNAMIYPAIIIITMLGIGTVIVTFVLPKLSEFFTSMNIELPIYTKLLIGFGSLAQNYWHIFILVFLILFSVIYFGLRTKIGKKIRDTILIKLPFFSSLVKKSNAASLIRSLSSLVAAGVPLVRSLEITSGALGNFYFKKALNEASEKVKKGEKLSSALKPHQDIFPFGAIEIIEVGEETGKTSTILKKLASFYEEEVISATEGLSTIIEPMLIIFLGAIVAFFAFSVIEPIYSGLGGIQ